MANGNFSSLLDVGGVPGVTASTTKLFTTQRQRQPARPTTPTTAPMRADTRQSAAINTAMVRAQAPARRAIPCSSVPQTSFRRTRSAPWLRPSCRGTRRRTRAQHRPRRTLSITTTSVSAPAISDNKSYIVKLDQNVGKNDTFDVTGKLWKFYGQNNNAFPRYNVNAAHPGLNEADGYRSL